MKIIKPYQSQDLLYFYYWMALMSKRKIAKLFGVAQITIIYWMKKLDIPSRSISEGNHLKQARHCHLSQKAKEFIDGELLGDGNFLCRNIYSARFRYSSKYKLYNQFITEQLLSFGIDQIGQGLKEKRKGKIYYHYCSCSYAELYPFYKRWYPNGKKIVSRDLKLTPLVCRQWYIGDGSLRHSTSKNGRPNAQLWTEGFSISDVEWLVEQLKNLNFKTTRQNSHNSIAISTYSTKDFLNYIGPCPEEIKSIYGYKWNYEGG